MRRSLAPLLLCIVALTCTLAPGQSFSIPGLLRMERSNMNPCTGLPLNVLMAKAASAASAAASDEPAPKKLPMAVLSRIKQALYTVTSNRLFLAVAALVTGYRIGKQSSMMEAATKINSIGAATAATTQLMTKARQVPIVTILLIAIGIKEIWFATPLWLKRNVPWIGKKYRSRDVPASEDLSSLGGLAVRMKSLIALASSKIKAETDEEDKNDSLTIAFLVLLQLMGQIKQKYAHQRDDTYRDTGRPIDKFSQQYRGLDETFDFADWAYNELPNQQTLEDALNQTGFTLFRHDKPEKPGYVSHYVAISEQRKTLLIGIKGTSSFEDFLTDCCGLPISHELPGPYVKGGTTSIRCHEGILLSAQRLVENLEVFVEALILPTRYKILITGHSLGAGVATIVGLLLRARFPTLLSDTTGTKLQVIAFASPPVLDCDSALACKSFCTTIVNNSDFIPRASLSNLLVLIEFLKILNNKLEATGKKPTDLVGVSQFLLGFATNDDTLLISVAEVMDSWDQAFNKIELRDPDHLFVPGKVILMYDLWETKDIPDPEQVRLTDGTSRVLRSIELDSEFLSDHLSDAYRSSIQRLLGTTISNVVS